MAPGCRAVGHAVLRQRPVELWPGHNAPTKRNPANSEGSDKPLRVCLNPNIALPSCMRLNVIHCEETDTDFIEARAVDFEQRRICAKKINESGGSNQLLGGGRKAGVSAPHDCLSDRSSPTPLLPRDAQTLALLVLQGKILLAGRVQRFR